VYVAAVIAIEHHRRHPIATGVKLGSSR